MMQTVNTQDVSIINIRYYLTESMFTIKSGVKIKALMVDPAPEVFLCIWAQGSQLEANCIDLSAGGEHWLLAIIGQL